MTHRGRLIAASLIALSAVAGCSGERSPAPAVPPVTDTAPATKAAPVMKVSAPAPVAGEIWRTELTADGRTSPGRTSVLKKLPKAGAAYTLRAACTSATPGATATYAVRSGKPGSEGRPPLLSGEMPCDGTELSDGFDLVEAEPITADLRGTAAAPLTTGYAVIVPG